MDLINAILVIVAILNTLLAFLLLSRARKATNFSFFLVVCAVILWTIAMIIYRAAPAEYNLFWCRVLYIMATFTASPFLYFTYIFPTGKKNFLRTILIFLPQLLIIAFLIIPDFIIKEVVIIPGEEKKIIFGPLYFAYSFYISGYFSLGLINLLRKYFKTSGIQKLQVKYVFWGYFLASNLAMSTNLILPWFGNFSLNWLGQILALFMAGFTVYAVVRYRLMNIKLVITRSLLYFFLTLLVTGSFVLGIFLTGQFFTDQGVGKYWVSAIIALAVVLGLEPLKQFFAKITDRIFYKEKIDYTQVLEEVSQIINEEIELKQLVERLNLELKDKLKLREAYLLLASGKECYLRVDELEEEKTRRRFHQRKNTACYQGSLIKYLKQTGELVVTDELERMMLDEADIRKQTNLRKILVDLQELKAAMAIPVFKEKKMSAILILGNKISGDVFIGDEFHLVQVISPQIASALEKSKLYQKVTSFNIKLQEEVDRATAKLKKTNLQLQEANEHLKQLDKAKSEFMSIASHQLRTPLTGIMGYLSMILQGDYGKVKADQKKIMKEVFQAAQRLIRLVNVFLNITRIEAGRFVLNYAEVDMHELVGKEVKELMPNAKKKGLKLVYNKPKKKLPKAIVDMDKIKDVAINLIDNSIKYTEEGSVTISLDAYNKNSLQVTVKDTGIGIAPVEAKKLFQKFVRAGGGAKIEAGGSGLGLYIVKKIVEAHEGKVWAESEGVGKGSTFKVVLPYNGKKKKQLLKEKKGQS